MIDRSSPMNLMTWNAHSLRPKKLEYFDFLLTHEISIASISETFLSGSDSIYHPDFITYRLDRESPRTGGGVCLTFRRGIQHQLLPCPSTEVNEALSAEVTHSEGRFVITSIYFPGSGNSEVLRAYKRDLQLLLSLYPDQVLTGDLNSRHRFWSCQRSNSAGRILYEAMSDGMFVFHHPNSPTHFPENGGSPSTLEVFLVKGHVDLVVPVTVNDLSSDHIPVLATVEGGNSVGFSSSFRVKDYEQADWVRFYRLVSQGLLSFDWQVSSRNEIDSSIGRFNQVVTDAEAGAVPLRTICPGSPRLPPHILYLKGQRNAMNRRWQRSRDRFYKDARDDLNRVIKHGTALLVNQGFGSALEAINEDPGPNRKKLWKLTRTIRNRSLGTPNLVVGGARLVSDPEKARAFAEHFYSIHERAAAPRLDATGRKVGACLRRLKRARTPADGFTLVTAAVVKEAVGSLKNRKAPGPDKVSNRCLKRLPEAAYEVLAKIFNACLRLGYFPSCWKEAIVIAVGKGGKPANEVSSYRLMRPISLLSTVGKLFESLILPEIRLFLDDNRVLPDHQYGFRTGRSCTLQLLRVTKRIRSTIASRKTAGILSLDLKAVFDSVWHDGLVYKLSTLGLLLYLVNLVDSFLEGRGFRVRVGHSLSEWFEVNAGVP